MATEPTRVTRGPGRQLDKGRGPQEAEEAHEMEQHLASKSPIGSRFGSEDLVEAPTH